MKKYRLSVITQVEVYIDIEADDECDALQETEDMEFALEERYGQGGMSLQLADDRMSMCAGEPNYDNRIISEIERETK